MWKGSIGAGWVQASETTARNGPSSGPGGSLPCGTATSPLGGVGGRLSPCAPRSSAARSTLSPAASSQVEVTMMSRPRRVFTACVATTGPARFCCSHPASKAVPKPVTRAASGSVRAP